MTMVGILWVIACLGLASEGDAAPAAAAAAEGGAAPAAAATTRPDDEAAVTRLPKIDGMDSLSCAVVTVPGSTGSGSASCSCLVFGSARFSVLTPSVVRLEHHAGCSASKQNVSDCFEDTTTTTFTNRAPPASGRDCTWAARTSASGRPILEINTSVLALRYTGGAFSADSLSITDRQATGRGLTAVWRPGSGSDGNLNGTFTSKDCGGMNPLTAEVCIRKYQSMMQPGLLTRNFGVLIDDTRAFLLDGDPDWPPYGWRKIRRGWAGYSDFTFFGHGRHYRQAMKEFILLSGPVQLMPHRHYGMIFSDHQSNLFMESSMKMMVNNFTARNLPLNYLVLDENWHYMGAAPSPGQCSVPGRGVPAEYQCASGFGGFTWDRTQVPDPVAFQTWVHAQNLSLMLNVHDQCGYDHCQRGYAEARAAVPGIVGPNATIPCQFENAKLQAAFFEHNLESGENALVDSLGGQTWGTCLPTAITLSMDSTRGRPALGRTGAVSMTHLEQATAHVMCRPLRLCGVPTLRRADSLNEASAVSHSAYTAGSGTIDYLWLAQATRRRSGRRLPTRFI